MKMHIAKGWANTYFLSIIFLITGVLFVNLLYLIYFFWTKEPLSITTLLWPLGTSVMIILLFKNIMKTLKYRLQKKFTHIAPLHVSEGVSLVLNEIALPFSLEYNTPIAFNPQIMAETLFIIKNSSIRIGLVPFKKGTWIFIKYDGETLESVLLQLCTKLDETIAHPVKGRAFAASQ